MAGVQIGRVFVGCRPDSHKSLAYLQIHLLHFVLEVAHFQNDIIVAVEFEATNVIAVVPDLYLCNLSVLGTDLLPLKLVYCVWMVTDRPVFCFEFEVAHQTRKDSLDWVVVV